MYIVNGICYAGNTNEEIPVPPAAVRMKWEKRPFRSGRRWQIKWTETAFTGTFSPGSIRFRTFGSGCGTSCIKSYNHQDSLANVPY